MIADASRYYGCVLHYLIDRCRIGANITRIDPSFPGAYLVNHSIPFYIKFSTARRGPWAFNFQKAHQEMQHSLAKEYGECVATFVCGKDGIVALRHNELRVILDENFEEQEGVTIKRRHNQMYQIRGRDGKLDKRVSRSSLEEIAKKLIKEDKL